MRSLKLLFFFLGAFCFYAEAFAQNFGDIPANTPVSSLWVPPSRLITINGETHDLSADRSWSVSVGGVNWGAIGGTLADQLDLQSALNSKVPVSRSINGKPLTADVTLTKSDLGLSNVTNDIQTKASVVPNTLPTSAQLLIGNVSGTAYLPRSISGSGATISLNDTGVISLSAIPNATLQNSSMTIGGTSVALGGTLSTSAILDSLGSTRGSVIYRGSGGWTVLPPGTDGYGLTTHGSGADPTWAPPGSVAAGGSNTQVQYNNGGLLGGTNDLVYSGGTFTANAFDWTFADNLDPTKKWKFDGTALPTATTSTISLPVNQEGTFNDTGTSGAPTSWTSAKNMMVESVAITADRFSTLPPANSFSSGTIITYLDYRTTGDFGRSFKPAGSDTLDGGTAYIKPFIAGGLNPGQGSYQFKTNGTNAWVSIYGNGRATKFQDPTNAHKSVAVDVSAQTPDAGFSFAPSPLGNSVSVFPSFTDIPGTAATSVDTTGALGYTQVVPDPRALPDGQVLTTSAGAWINSTIAQSITPWASLGSAPSFIDNSTTPATIVWVPAAGQGQQNGFFNLVANTAMQLRIDSGAGALQTGQTFNLLLKQASSGTGSVVTFYPASDFLTPSNGLGTIRQTLTNNAVDYYEIKYVGNAQFPFVVTNTTLNLTSATPPPCNTAGITGSTAGTNAGNAMGTTSANNSRANNFQPGAGDVNICSISVPLRATGAPNYQLHAAIYTDSIRSGGNRTITTTSGQATIVDAAGGFSANDVGMRLVIDGGFPGTDYFVGTFTNSTTVRVSSSRTSQVDVTATSGTSTSCHIYGKPGTQVAGMINNNTVNSSGLPNAATATLADAVASPTLFSGMSGTLTSGTNYFLVVWADAPTNGDAVNYVQWVYDSTGTSRGYTNLSSGDRSTWSVSGNQFKSRFTTYH